MVLKKHYYVYFMGFSSKIREKVLIACARHCCICHRYKGIKIEVHHIIQEAYGGLNTFTNAIPLCFDCHADVGHYNDKHPKGSKFTISELTTARDKWYEFVKNQPLIEKVLSSDHIQTMYYVLHTFEILESVLNKDFKSVNKYRKQTYLYENFISNQWRDLLKLHLNDYQSNIDQTLIIECEKFKSIKAYIKKYDNVELIDKFSDEFPYYVAKRKVNWINILSFIKPNSFLSRINELGIDADRFCTFLLAKNEPSCGGSGSEFGYTEYLCIEPISFIFLGITNASKVQIKLNWLIYKDNIKLKLPSFNLLPYEMVLVPIATAINLSEIKNSSISLGDKGGDRAVDFSRVIGKQDFNERDVIFFKDKITPSTVVYNDNKSEYEVDIHNFDYNNLYSINAYWQCGCCPHLFFVNDKGQQKYVRELLIHCSGKGGFDIIDIPSNVFNIITQVTQGMQDC